LSEARRTVSPRTVRERARGRRSGSRGAGPSQLQRSPRLVIVSRYLTPRVTASSRVESLLVEQVVQRVQELRDPARPESLRRLVIRPLRWRSDLTFGRTPRPFRTDRRRQPVLQAERLHQPRDVREPPRIAQVVDLLAREHKLVDLDPDPLLLVKGRRDFVLPIPEPRPRRFAQRSASPISTSRMSCSMSPQAPRPRISSARSLTPANCAEFFMSFHRPAGFVLGHLAVEQLLTLGRRHPDVAGVMENENGLPTGENLALLGFRSPESLDARPGWHPLAAEGRRRRGRRWRTCWRRSRSSSSG
jgi:hypothetical protein